jgi:hypothetical protein
MRRTVLNVPVSRRRARDRPKLSITLQHTQESLCLAHIYALAGVAGVNYAVKHVYDYGVDGQFAAVTPRRNGRLATSGYPLDFQAKATINWDLVDGNIVYDLEAKTYDDMVSRDVSETTLLLILLCLPKSLVEWHESTESATTIRHCCYWQVLHGEPCGNKSTKRIFIPVANLLTPDTLKALLAAERIRRQNQLL